MYRREIGASPTIGCSSGRICSKFLGIEEIREMAWIWDGNIPARYKTPCGKALGRWINNQRSAKAKDKLKDDRKVRLISTCLRWRMM